MTTIRNESETQARSHLFTVRIWMEERPDGKKEWRGKAQHVLRGDVKYFRDWATLVAYLEQSLVGTTADKGK